jgi:hypothetical protein
MVLVPSWPAPPNPKAYTRPLDGTKANVCRLEQVKNFKLENFEQNKNRQGCLVELVCNNHDQRNSYRGYIHAVSNNSQPKAKQCMYKTNYQQHISKATGCNGLRYKINKGFRITADVIGNQLLYWQQQGIMPHP